MFFLCPSFLFFDTSSHRSGTLWYSVSFSIFTCFKLFQKGTVLMKLSLLYFIGKNNKTFTTQLNRDWKERKKETLKKKKRRNFKEEKEEKKKMSYHHSKLTIRITVLGSKNTGKSSKSSLSSIGRSYLLYGSLLHQ